MISKIVQTVDFKRLQRNKHKVLKELALQSMPDDPGKLLRDRIKKGVNWNGDKLTPLKKSTLNIRKMRGRPGNKPMVDTGKLLKSIKTKKTKTKVGVTFFKYGLHQAKGFTTNNHFAVKDKKGKVVGWRDYSGGIRVTPRSWIYPEKGSEHLGLTTITAESKKNAHKTIKKYLKGKVVHKTIK